MDAVVDAAMSSNPEGVGRVEFTVQVEDEANKQIGDGTELPDVTANVIVNGTNCGVGTEGIVVDDISVEGTSGSASLHGVVESCVGTLTIAVRDAPLTAYEGAPAR